MKNAIKHLAHLMQQAEPGAEFSFEFWDGERLNLGDQPAVILRLKSEESAARLLGDGFLGFGEAYMAGDLEVEGELQELLRLGIAARFDQKEPSFWKKLWLLPGCLKSKNSVRRAPRNISHHYDLGDDSLEQAQQNKYEHIARKLMLSPGDRLVDIGCGWGWMLIYAAQKYGVNGLGNTISRHQYEYAKRKIEELGLEDQIEVVLEDYRHLKGEFDKLVSIGMFEHVGKEYISSFMKNPPELLIKGGLGLLHTIGKETASPADPWTMRYIFPGNYLPNLPEVAHHMGRARLSILDVENLRLHYARTLDCWAHNFEKEADKVRERLGESFTRMWQLYLHASSAGFKYAETRLYQILFSNGLNNQLPMTREHVYSGRDS